MKAEANERALRQMRRDPPGLYGQVAEALGARGALFGLVERDFRLRYKQAVLGPAWVLLQPLMAAFVFTLVFSAAGRSHLEGQTSYLLFTFAGLLLWQYMARTVVDGSACLVVNADLVARLYVPRLLLPLAVAISGVLDLMVGLVCLLVYCLLLGQPVGWSILALPAVIAMGGVLAFGVALWLAPLEALYRDVPRVIPVLVQPAMFLAPVVYPPSLIPEGWRWLVLLNPATAVVEGARFAVLGMPAPGILSLTSWAVASLLLILGGLWLFRRLEDLVVEWV